MDRDEKEEKGQSLLQQGPTKDYSLKEGETIGRGLAMALVSNLTAEAAVDEWVLKYNRSLGELDRTEAWFR